ncbi:cGMP-specific 3',5'-cyclic phosphodiesterase isoform X1 [Thunnus albacares]|uniref:cGMP-specific 3',5'-cyclic phosphodiesterase isoform X1 n=1 Tax=Thunnus albacares TaxID=8236 RepID=UPI001CF6BFC9|nr:cGMP-specific 3',5'-cyclic phosphodiesterase isoform X1 [Thunnus albacares]XP_044197070.1 cGMP-specific 3',5'-cyclic phosphodiesterase isoform X1 [Thunnus albacares]XP_044197071.1 cGMP-specific 3',5'-cyclic phosphodiesterase isoform X1 [Thunnus albacares]
MEDCCSPGSERMEAWLDDHLEFTHSYFIRKASREMVNAWFAERVHTIQPSASKENPAQQRSHQSSADTGPPSAPSSSTILPANLNLLDNRSPSPATVSSPAPGTPTRKISASEFDRPLRPIVVKDSEGSLTFLSDSDRETVPLRGSVMGEGVSGGGGNGGSGSDRCARLLELVKEVSSHLDVTALCHKIFLHINELIAADRYSLFLVGEDSSNRKFLVSRLFDVAEGSTLEESSSNCIRLEWNKGIVGHVAATGQPLNIKNAYEDPRFNAEVDLITGYKTQSILCLPIKNHRDEVVGVAQAINKKCGENGAFTEQDEKDFSAYLAFSGIVLHNAQLYETSQLENRRNQVLLDLASLIFEEQQCLEVLLRKIAGTILSFMQAQACTVFIADEDSMNSFSSVFHMEYEELDEVLDAPKRDCDVSQINYMYAQYVKNTMQPLNIADVTKDQRFPWTSENPDHTSNQIKSLLCTPIRNGKKDKVIGVCQLVNKMDEASGSVKAFNRNDEQFLEAFAIFCGLGIQNTQMYETVERAMAKQEVTLEVLSYHASAAEEESRELQVTAVATIPSAQSLRLMDFSFSDFDLSDTETTLATVRMFVDLNLVQNFQMKHTSLCQWILSVKKNYRKNVAYHNWRHAFNTSQCMFALLKSGRLQNNLSDLEVLALMIATLSHDLDHRGVNNSYIQRSDHPLAQLYCHSTMEHHHFDQCLMILTSPGNQILSGLSLDEYKATLKMIERAILATDLALYMKRRGEFFELTKNSQFVWEDEHHRDLLRSMLMTACDISAITKPWPVQKRIAELVATEFFEQGDKEREELNIEPSDLMNREKRDKIPSMQVSFIDAICTQLYETLAGMSEYCSPLLEGCQKNRQHWKCLAEECEKGPVNGLV